ncbi:MULTISPECIES: HAD family hydrolase [Saccharothrix]|uniref:HAD family hydrolase n=1 Tax=Saccharothrix TaxID=2071 RepID=UPI0009F8E419|nr:HAD family phosphatase [Saccharothrix sp. CB00851]
MTADEVPVDDPDVLGHILANTDVLLLDFDGPICSIFAGLPARRVATRLREVLMNGGHADLPPDVANTEDPFDVFRYAATLGEHEALYLEAALRANEIEAVATAEPTRGAEDLIVGWAATGRKLCVVSNNSDAAITTYLQRQDWIPLFETVSARSSSRASQLKPAPELVIQAIVATSTPPGRCTLVGDSIADVQAAHAAGVRSIAFANKVRKVDVFRKARPEIIVTTLPTAVSSALE